MGKILDAIVGNTYVFIGIIAILVIIFLALVISIIKGFRKKKIPIYEEDLDKKELAKVKSKNIIDKPVTKKKKPSNKEKVEKTEKEEKIEKTGKSEKTEKKEKSEKIEIEKKEKKEEPKEVISKNEEEDSEEAEEVVEEEYTEEQVAALENVDEKEIEKRIDQEHEEAIKEAMEEIDNDAIKDALYELKEKQEMTPEEVVRKFEQEQEAQSIISYQELVDVVKNRDNNFEDELESKPLATVSDFLPEQSKEKSPQNQKMVELIEQIGRPTAEESKEKKIEEVESIFEPDSEETIEEIPTIAEATPKIETLDSIMDTITETPVESLFEMDTEEIETLGKEKSRQEQETEEKARQAVREALRNSIPDEGRFKKTEVISPVFGRIVEPEAEYSSVKKFNRDDEKKQSLNTIEELPELGKSDMIGSKAMAAEDQKAKKDTFSSHDLSKNEDLLQALKDFRDSL